MSNWEKISSDSSVLNNVYKSKKNINVEAKVSKNDVFKYLEDGFSISKEYKNGLTLLFKQKTHFDYYEDRIWQLFYKMCFTHLNIDRTFKITYSSNNSDLTQQIDVFALDDETVILVECKSTDKVRTSNFKVELEAYSGKLGGIKTEINKIYPDRKIAFIWATNNYDIGEQDAARIKEFGFSLFTEKTISYFENLAEHLGTSAKYQLLGYLFPNKDIKNLNAIVPAIQGSMGGHKYYSFMIKPDDLLKLSYVLHRNNANNEMMPTYQRLIKKERLAQIRSFINNKGYFPNSIILNINEDMVFDLASQKNSSYSDAKIGLLHLPKKYRSAYIIDGQHRLYGYSDTDYASKHTIPIIAFVNLDQGEQVKMFMDINENQKSVPKILRNTLIKDLYLESKDKNEVRIAQSLIVADRLGDIKKSPLFNRVLIGENKKTDLTSITLENLRIAIYKNSDFFSSFGKNNILVKTGTFDFDNVDLTTNALTDFLIQSLDVIREYNQEEWNKGSKDGFLAANNTVMAIIYLINDFINIIDINPKLHSVKEVVEKTMPFLLSLCQVISDLSPEKKTEFKKAYGAGGPNVIYKELGYEINLINNNYSPSWLKKYIEDNKQDNVIDAHNILVSLKDHFINIIKTKLNVTDDFSTVVDDKLYMEIENEKSRIRLKFMRENKPYDGNFWPMLSFDIFGKIINSRSNWSTLFKEDFDKFVMINGKKQREIMSVLDSFNAKIESKFSLPLSDYEWLLNLDTQINKDIVEARSM